MDKKSFFLWVLLGFAVLLSGCASTKYHSPARAEAGSVQAGEEPLAGIESLPRDLDKKKNSRVAYTVGPDDVITIVVRQHPDAGGEFKISPEGTIFIPLIGSVSVEGMTTEEMTTLLKDRYGEYIKEPEVGVSVSAYNSKKVYVLGQVERPGEYTMKGNTLSVRDAVILAGLPMITADLPGVLVITPHETDPYYVKINLGNILYKGIMRENIELKPDDVVVVHRNIPAKIGAFLDQILGPTSRLRAAEQLSYTLQGDRR